MVELVLANTPEVTLVLSGVPATVGGFEATHAGERAGIWDPVASASKGAAAGTWEVTVKFAVDARAIHAALVRSK